MKPGIHPEYAAAKITCACGRSTEGFSTVGEIHVEICSHCHPFFTGKQKLVDTAGRVERFKARYGDISRPRKATPASEPSEPSASQAADVPEATPDAPEAAVEPAEVVAEAALAETPEVVDEAPEAVDEAPDGAEASDDADAGGSAEETEEEPAAGES